MLKIPEDVSETLVNPLDKVCTNRDNSSPDGELTYQNL